MCLFEHTIPIKIRGEIVGAVSFAKYAVSFKRELSVKSPNDFQKPFYCLEDIIGDSLLIRQLKNQIASVTKTNSSVLIYGETGTGKELVAQSIHSGVNGAIQFFLSQNCSAIPLSLLEGLLFGTVKGSFTGAEDKAGIFENRQWRNDFPRRNQLYGYEYAGENTQGYRRKKKLQG